jgi:urea transport system ATP-binding protein
VSVLAVQNLEVSIGDSRILRDVSFTVEPKEVVCLMGRNGVGKTTTLKAVMGLIPASGQTQLEGESIGDQPTETRSLRGIGYVPQGRDIFPNLTVWENLQVGLVVRGRRANGQVDRVLDLFPVLKTMLKRKGGVLSGGQQQQLAIGRALLTEPKLLILDEPTEGIQPSIVDEIGRTLALLRAEGQISILLVEQCLDFARAVADRFYVMQKGTIVAGGAMADMSEQVVRQHLSV